MTPKTRQEAEAIVAAMRIESPVLARAMTEGLMDPHNSRGIHTPEAITALAEEMKITARQGSPLEVAERLSLYSGMAIGGLEGYARVLAGLEVNKAAN